MDDEFVVFENVPIFDEDEDLDRSDLQRIVDANNRRMADTGDACPLVIGHTIEGAPEDKQPEIVGWADSFRLGSIGTVKPRACILARFRIYKERADEARNYPRRSIELWDDGTIDPIALLGASTPQKNLGLLFKKNQSSVARYSRNLFEVQMDQENTTQNPTSLEDVIAACLQAVEQSEIGQYVRKMMADGTEDEVEAPKDDEPEKNETTESDNEEEKKDDEPDQNKKFARVRIERDSLRTKVSKYEAALAEKDLEVASLVKKYNRSKRERDLIRLENEGFVFDMADELEQVESLSDAQYEAHIARIKKNYQRAPIGVRFESAKLSDAGLDPSFSKERMERVVAHATANKVPYEQAMKEIR